MLGFGRRPPLFVESLAFGRSEAGVPVPLIGLPSPESEGGIERGRGVAGTVLIEEPAPLLGQPSEPHRVDLVVPDLEDMPVAARDDHIVRRAVDPTGIERPSEPRDVGAERLLCRSRRAFAPQLFDEVVDRHNLAGVGDEEGEDRPFLRSRDPQAFPAFPGDLEGTEDKETHRD